MTTTAIEHSTTIAVFADQEQANKAIDDLRHAGYSYDQIRLVRRGSNSFTENLKSLFSQTATTTNSPDDWMRIGVPEQDARHYQSELDAGRSIVLIKAVDNPEQALSIMRQNGAFDIVSRLRTAQPTTTPGTVNPSAQAGTYNPNTQAGAYNPDAQAGAYNPNAAPGTNYPDVPPRT